MQRTTKALRLFMLPGSQISGASTHAVMSRITANLDNIGLLMNVHKNTVN